MRRGEPTRRSISGSSACSCSTMLPIGSSTSGSQISWCSVMPTPGSWSLSVGGRSPGPPCELPGDGQQEHGEETPERALRERRRHLHSGLDADDRGETEDERASPPDVSVVTLAPRAGSDRGQDREERGRLGVELAEPEPDEGRDEEDPAADPEEARQ